MEPGTSRIEFEGDQSIDRLSAATKGFEFNVLCRAASD